MTHFSLEFKIIKGFGKVRKFPFYEVRLLFLRKVKFLLGFFDFNNNFVFFKFNLFFFYFSFFGISVDKMLKDLNYYDFLVLLFSGYQIWLNKNQLLIPFFLRKRLYCRLNIILNKILCRRFNSYIVGFTWGKLLCKQMLVVRRISHDFILKKLHYSFIQSI